MYYILDPSTDRYFSHTDVDFKGIFVEKRDARLFQKEESARSEISSLNNRYFYSKAIKEWVGQLVVIDKNGSVLRKPVYSKQKENI